MNNTQLSIPQIGVVNKEIGGDYTNKISEENFSDINQSDHDLGKNCSVIYSTESIKMIQHFVVTNNTHSFM